MELNESKFLEELRKIDGEVRLAYLNFNRPRMGPSNLTEAEQMKIEKESEEMDRQFHMKIREPLETLSYLLSLVETDSFDDVIREVFPFLKNLLREVTLPPPSEPIQSSPFYSAIWEVQNPKDETVKIE